MMRMTRMQTNRPAPKLKSDPLRIVMPKSSPIAASGGIPQPTKKEQIQLVIASKTAPKIDTSGIKVGGKLMHKAFGTGTVKSLDK